jgi:hypothetical protein
MNKLDIKEGKLTPKICFDAESNIFEISGSSLPENVHEFYKPVMNWIKEYELHVFQVNKPLHVAVNFAYYNSSSFKYIVEIFSVIARMNKKGLETNIEWHYEKEDDILKEAGQDISELTGLKFNFIII